MREIKFIAYQKSKNRIFPIYGLGSDFVTEDTLDGVNPETNAFQGKQMEDIEVMEFTGLKDKNGEDIYEGYVVMPSGDEGVLAQIIFIPPSFKITTKLKNGNYINWNYIKDEIEVIGNIHENPELLNLQK